MLTIEQAINANTFHANGCFRTIGPRGGVKEVVIKYRRNGSTKTWKTRPNEYSIPIKYSWSGYGYINDANSDNFHVESDCPLLNSVRFERTTND